MHSFEVFWRTGVPDRRSCELNRRSLPDIHRALVASFPQTHFLSSKATREAALTMSGLGIGGGAVYDGLVACAAVEAGRRLATRDVRALPTYQALGVDLLRLLP